jgi:hypothetical protein
VSSSAHLAPSRSAARRWCASPGFCLIDDDGFFWRDVASLRRHLAPEAAEAELRAQIEPARSAGIDPPHIDAHMAAAMLPELLDCNATFATLVELQAGALIVSADPFFGTRREQLVALAAHHAVPTIYFRREFAELGGLISYASSLTAAFRLVGVCVGKILNSAKPADLPVQQPTTFELVVNLKDRQGSSVSRSRRRSSPAPTRSSSEESCSSERGCPCWVAWQMVA